MSGRADFAQWTMGPVAVLVVPAAEVEQRVVVLAPAGGLVVADSFAKASGAAGYVLQTTAVPFYLAPHQALWAGVGRLAIGSVISVYVAPTEDDYLESGAFWQDHREEHHA